MDEQKKKKKPAKAEDEKTQTAEGEAGGMTLSPEEVAELKGRIETLQKEREEYLATAQRLQAEFDNFRKRTATARVESFDDGVREAMTAMLPVLDNFERAVGSLDEAAKKDGFAQGMLMVQKQLLDELCKLGMEEIDTSGAFDPDWHDAVLMVDKEGVEPGDVAEVIQKGYKFKEKPIRCSVVQVAK